MTRVITRATLPPGVPTAPGPAAYPLRLYRGDSYHWQFKLWADSAKTQPVDLTGVTVKAEIRDRSSGSTIVPMVCVVSLPNTVDAQLPAAASTLAPTGGWDLQLTYPDGRTVTVLAGNVTVTGDITDST